MKFHNALLWAFIALFVISEVRAEGLPILEKDPFFGCYMAHEVRGSRYRVGRDGKLEMKLIRKGDQESHSHKLEIHFFVKEQDAKNPQRWVRKKFNKDEFKPESEAKVSPVESSFIAKASNGAEVRVTYQFKGKLVYFGMEPLSKGEAKKSLRYGFEVKLRRSYQRFDGKDRMSDKDWKKALRRDRFELKTKGGNVKLKFNERVKDVQKKYEKELKSGVSGIAIKSEDFMGRSVAVGVAKGSDSKMEYKPARQNGRLCHGAVFVFEHEFDTKLEGAWGFASFTK